MTSGSETNAAPRRVLLLLLLAYVFNFVDRNIIGILAVPIREEFDLSDTALGQLGVAFGILYALVALPLGALADSGRRVTIVSGAVALWSLFTALCGLVSTFPQLIAARMGVAIGEAGGVAPSYALIADHFPREKRSRALAIFSLGVPLGSAAGLMFGGWLAQSLSWRAAFLILGFAGLPVALLIAWLIPEPVKGRLDRLNGPAGAGARADLRRLVRVPSFWLLSLGAACGSVPGYGLIFWLPSYFNRSLGLEVGDVGWFYGSIVLVGGVAGVWFGGWLGDRAGASRPAYYALLPAGAFLMATPMFIAGLFATDLAVAWLLFTLAQMLTLSWFGPVLTAVQQVAAPNVRSTASAGFLFVNNLVGIAGGIYLLGWLSDAFKLEYGADSLRYSILAALIFYLLSALIYLVCARFLERDLAGAKSLEI